MDRQQFIEDILDYYQHPRNKGRMADADLHLGGGNPGCGDLVTVYIKLSADGERIEKATFEGSGCTVSQAGASMVAEMLEGLTVADVQALGTDTMRELVGEDAVKQRVRCATLGLATFQAALEEHRRQGERDAAAARVTDTQ
jgi:nitrogen fixation NifU-like protein